MTDIGIDRPEEAKTHKTQQKKYYKFQKTWKKK